MRLSGIQDFLEEYRKRLFKAEDERSNILRIIYQVSGVELKEEDIEIRKNEIILRTDAVMKNQTFLYKEKILKELKNSGVNFFDIH